jgi:hypothetical protein
MAEASDLKKIMQQPNNILSTSIASIYWHIAHAKILRIGKRRSE